uniref:J domain-containing protein n=1 Tax=Leersia perrieri TaxID=77586 RepID=A0A0D9XTI3_9ORYZ
MGSVWFPAPGLTRLNRYHTPMFGWVHVGLSLAHPIHEALLGLAPRKRDWDPFLPSQAQVGCTNEMITSLMECNREEALRAREIAVKKLRNRDFVVARKIAIKAQRLFPELENISQLLTTCEVLSSADTKISGDLDWYGILQVNKTADESEIRRQYNRLSYWLHPDNNTLFGAEDAFRFVSEAHSVLSDHVKRSQYDIKRQCASREVDAEATQPPNKTDANTSNDGLIPSSDSVLVFWTICPHCQKQYLYYKRNFMARCDDCGKSFFAFKVREQPVPSRILSIATKKFQVSPEMFSFQQSSVPNQKAQYVNPSVRVDTNFIVRANVEETDESIKQYGWAGDMEGKCLVTRSGTVQLSEKSQIKSGVGHVPDADNNKPGTLVPKSPNLNSISVQNLTRENASAGTNAAESSNLQILGRGRIYCSSDSCHGMKSINRQRKYNCPSGSDSTNELTCNDDGSVPDNQSTGHHVNIEVSSEEEGNARPGGNRQDYKKNVTDTASQKSVNSVIGCPPDFIDFGKSRDAEEVDEYIKCHAMNSNIKRQRKYNSPSNPDLSNEHICSDNVAAPEIQSSLQHVPIEVYSEEKGNEKHGDSQGDIDTVSQNSANSAIAYPSPDFFDFDKSRDVYQIAIDQIWAVYDGHDCMPRAYARINHVDPSNLKAQFTWLVHSTVNEQNAKGTHEKLPFACGNFCLGETDVLQDSSRYLSHNVSWTSKNGTSYDIHPNKGEVWALYKGWSMQFSSDANRYQSYGYDIVQVLSSGPMDAGVTVSPLVRIAGFVSLFVKAKNESSFLISSCEALRFSHSIPFYTTNGNERIGVPEGFLELDTAALPSDLDAAFPPITLDSYMSSDNKTNTEVIIYACPDPEFYNFEHNRSHDKFEPGQIWALYSDTDKFPNFYGWVNKVEMEPFNVHLNWLEACPQNAQEKRWLEHDVPMSCGTFEIQNMVTKYSENYVFSHLVETKRIGAKCQVKIRPKIGEVWAIYKNWSAKWVPSHTTRGTKYAIGQIVECTEAFTLFGFLTKVVGHISVFKPDLGKGILKIPVKESLRFSHRIPSFCLTKEKGGKLHDCYELDPAAVPDDFLQKG